MLWRMRGLVVSALIAGVVVPASASFELILALDLSGKVCRYDGDTGAYLGSFGQGWIDNTSTLSINRTKNEAYITKGYALRTFNYNTGELLRTINTTGIASASTVLSDGRVALVTTSGSIVLNDPLSGYLGTLGLPAGVAAPTFFATTGSTWVIGEGGANRFFRSVNSGSNWTQINVGSGQLGSAIEQSVFSGNAFGDFYVAKTGAGSYNFLTSGGAYGSVVSTFTSTTGVANGHDGSNWFMGVSASGTKLMKTDRLQYEGFNFIASQVTTPGDLAVVVAPEPSTVLGLTIGAIVLLRRKRR